MHEGEVKSVRELYKEMESLTDQMQEWKAKFKNLEKRKKKCMKKWLEH